MRDNVNDSNREREWSIELTWDLRTFAPYAASALKKEEPWELKEILWGSDLPKTSNKNDYWSAAERLLDLWWLKRCDDHRNDYIFTENPLNVGQPTEFDVLSQEFVRAESGIAYIVGTFRNWLYTAEKNWPELESLGRMEDVKTIESAEQAVKALEGIFQWSRTNKDILIEHYGKIEEAARLVGRVTVRDSRKKSLQDIAGALIRNIEIAERMRREKEPNQADQYQKVYDLFQKFFEKSKDFFENKVWRKESKAVTEIEKLEQSVQVLWNDYRSINMSSAISAEDQINLQTGMQKAADQICKMLFAAKGREMKLEELQQKIDEAVARMKSCKIRWNGNIKKYFSDTSRCVALIDVYDREFSLTGDSIERIIAFSGFLDCEDAELRRKLNKQERMSEQEEKLMDAFQEIGNSLHARVARLSKEVVDNIKSYYIDDSLELNEEGPLRKEIGKQNIHDIKRKYACCERKILSQMEADHRRIVHCNANVLVKFEPCIRCYCALKEWKWENALSVRLQVPKLRENE